MRFTKIVATVGPSTSTPENLKRLAAHGVNVCRLNFSHGNYQAHGQVIAEIRKINDSGDHCMGIMLDTKGPEVRTGDVEQPIVIEKGDRVVFTHKPTGREKLKVICVDHDNFAADAKHAKRILLDNGTIEFRITAIKAGIVTAEALEGGKVGSRRHVNLPGAYISLPSFTPKDWEDIRFGIKQGVDFIATSFVRTGEDMQQLRVFLDKHGSRAEIIAKIETPQAVDNIDEIINMSDGIMVARGDLGAEIPFEDVPRIQNEIVLKCRRAAKPVIVATHMLESMILNPIPTRAEVTDIAHAAAAQADSTMLSGETASGMYPFKSIDAMNRVLRANERVPFAIPHEYHTRAVENEFDAQRRQQALSASLLAQNLRAKAIVVITKRGLTAKAISNCRPHVPIFAFTEEEGVQRRLSLVWGISPHRVKLSSKPEETVQNALKQLTRKNVLRSGHTVVVVSDILISKTHVMTVQIRTV